ncbi:hypothetical protein TKK_0015441 [Trichogramma kaykai]|uniref:Reverse transcriptase domain-containing protein n=1 Tax=Trichogramma kaykai TaxID=54128 RepID=A0ABD2W9X6_9HYME
MGNCKSKNCDIKSMKVNDVMIKDPDEMANKFNKYFSDIGKQLARKIREPDIPFSEMCSSIQCNQSSMFLVLTSRIEIEKVISELKDRNSGVDYIHTRVLKAIARYISPVLERVLNDCISSGHWSVPLKQADIVPVFKSGNAAVIDNYRPISLISNLAKIVEKLIHSRLIVFLEKFCRIKKEQYGFLRNVNTTGLLDRIVNEIHESVNKDEAVLATIIDLSKAFDTGQHDLLLTKLEIQGIRGLALKLMRSYLSDRGQKLKINGVTSQVKTVGTGGPQDSALGPLLFIIYVNDIFNYCPGTYAFANDTIVVNHADAWSEV